MHNHERSGYLCPFCKLVQGRYDEINRGDYVVFGDQLTVAFVAPKWWVNNSGHVLVIPKEHVENIYDIPDHLLAATNMTAKRIATAIRATYGAAGTSTRQHNEPAGDQDVWHFHIHVFPRYPNDGLYARHAQTRWVGHDERMMYVDTLKEFLSLTERSRSTVGGSGKEGGDR